MLFRSGSEYNYAPVFQPVIDGHILDDQGGQQINVRTDGKSPTLRVEMHGNIPAVLGVLASSAENAEITDGIISPCLMARAGTGGNQLPLVALSYDERGNGDGRICNTITGDHNNRITDYTSVVVSGQPVYCLQGNGIDRADTAGCNGRV